MHKLTLTIAFPFWRFQVFFLKMILNKLFAYFQCSHGSHDALILMMMILSGHPET